MELLDTYETIAEIAIALTGFSGVVVALQSRGLGGMSSRARFFLTALLYWSLGTVFLAFTPRLLASFGPEVAWRVSHGLFALFHLGVFVWVIRSMMQQRAQRVYAYRVVSAIGVVVLATEIAVALGYLQDLAPYTYLLALLWFVFLAAACFVELVIGPASPASEAA